MDAEVLPGIQHQHPHADPAVADTLADYDAAAALMGDHTDNASIVEWRELSVWSLCALGRTDQAQHDGGLPTPKQLVTRLRTLDPGLAAISLPAGEADGLPIGVQLVGADDALLLGVAARMV